MFSLSYSLSLILSSPSPFSLQLLDLMDSLHTSAGGIVEMAGPEAQVALWAQALCPLLQGIAR